MSGNVYFILNAQAHSVKIGFAQNVERRLSRLKTSSPDRLEMFASVSGTMADEDALQRALADRKKAGEWFKWDLVTHELMERAKAGEPVDRLVAWAKDVRGLTTKQIEETLS